MFEIFEWDLNRQALAVVETCFWRLPIAWATGMTADGFAFDTR